MGRLPVCFQRRLVFIDLVIIEPVRIILVLGYVEAQAAGLVFSLSAPRRGAPLTKCSATVFGFYLNRNVQYDHATPPIRDLARL